MFRDISIFVISGTDSNFERSQNESYTNAPRQLQRPSDGGGVGAIVPVVVVWMVVVVVVVATAKHKVMQRDSKSQNEIMEVDCEHKRRQSTKSRTQATAAATRYKGTR